MLVAFMTAFTFASCEDVPAPYGDPNNNGGNEQPGTEEVAEGDGTAENPFNAVAANKYVEAGENLDAYVYVKGIVSNVKECSAQYGNATFYITADGTSDKTSFYIYRVKGLGNKNIASDDAVKQGDEVVVCAKLTNYNGTYETVQGSGYIYSINGQTDGGNTPSTGVATGDGTKDNPFNSVAANAAASKLADGEESEEVYIKGKVVSVKDPYAAQYGNASFYISDDGKADNQFYCFHTLYLNNEKWTEGKANIAAGDDVVVCGKLVNYKGNTPETAGNKAWLVSLKSNGGSSEGDVVGDKSLPNGDFECWVDGKPNNWKTTSSAGNATLSQSTDAHSGKYSVKVAGATTVNKRLGYKEMELKAGKYTKTFYAKAATATGASVRPGYVPVADGKVNGTDYKYGDYVNDITNTAWVLVTYEFEIAENGTYSLVIMNAKKPGGDVLIDDFKLVCGSEVIIK